MNARGVRRYLPVTVAAVVIVAFLVLAYLAGFRAGRASVAQPGVYNRVAR